MDLWSDVPSVETSHGQVWYYFGQDNLGQIYPQAETSCGQVCYDFGQADLWSHVPPHPKIRLWVMLTCGQIYPKKTSGGQVWYHIRSLQWKTSFCLYLLRQLNWSHIWAHIILCKKPKSEKVIWTWKDYWPPGWLLHHERPFYLRW